MNRKNFKAISAITTPLVPPLFTSEAEALRRLDFLTIVTYETGDTGFVYIDTINNTTFSVITEWGIDDFKEQDVIIFSRNQFEASLPIKVKCIRRFYNLESTDRIEDDTSFMREAKDLGLIKTV